MKTPYAEQCLERAEKVTEDRLCMRPYCYNCEMNKQFMVHAKRDVIELARRLKKAIKALRNHEAYSSWDGITIVKPYQCLVDELEAPVKESK